jgi:putative transposase
MGLPVRKKKPATTQPDPNAVGADNLLAPAKQQGLIAEPNRAWVGDVVYLSTKQEAGYLATLLAGYSGGWAVSTVNDTALTLKALKQALASRQPAVGLIHHLTTVRITPVRNIGPVWKRLGLGLVTVGKAVRKKTA